MTDLVVEIASTPVVVQVGNIGIQGPVGPEGPAGAAAEFTAETDDALVPGTPVYVKANGHLADAQADALPQARARGLAITTTAPTFAADVRTQGVVELTTGEWDVVTGDTGGLVPAANYYVDQAAAGMMTQTPPTTGVVTRVGAALSTTILDVNPEPPMKL